MSKWDAIRKLEVGQSTVITSESPITVAKALKELRTKLKRDLVSKITYEGILVTRLDRAPFVSNS
jgi:hypothetical protein